MVEIKKSIPLDCQKCGSCCRSGQTIELTVNEAEKLGKTTKLKINIGLTLEHHTLLWQGVVCELLEDCGYLENLADGRVACGVYGTSEMPGACQDSQPGWGFCLDAINSQKAI